jgi:hypothetical protein
MSPIRHRQELLMLDHAPKTARLLAALKAAVPFEVKLTERLVKYLDAQGYGIADTHHIVSELSYAGDEGGIVCHTLPAKGCEGGLVVSLTRSMCRDHIPLRPPLPTIKSTE